VVPDNSDIIGVFVCMLVKGLIGKGHRRHVLMAGEAEVLRKA